MTDREREWNRILKEKQRIVAEFEQMIRDANYWNGLPQADGNTLDIEPERVALFHARKSLEQWEAGDTIGSQEAWSKVVAAVAQANAKEGV